MYIPILSRIRHRLILSNWKVWLFPFLCAVPYCLALIWMFSSGLHWITFVLIAPLLMASVIGVITWYLARKEFR